jgi:tRNA(fMet)-specific endonuclease VapC
MKPTYLLDTNICIHIRRERPPAVMERFKALAPGAVAMSVITYGELSYGVFKGETEGTDRNGREKLHRLTQLIPVLPLPVEAADRYGWLRDMLRPKGLTIGNNDLWIASHALAAGLTVVTNNRREFDRCGPDLKVEDWTVAGTPS